MEHGGLPFDVRRQPFLTERCDPLRLLVHPFAVDAGKVVTPAGVHEPHRLEEPEVAFGGVLHAAQHVFGVTDHRITEQEPCVDIPGIPAVRQGHTLRLHLDSQPFLVGLAGAVDQVEDVIYPLFGFRFLRDGLPVEADHRRVELAGNVAVRLAGEVLRFLHGCLTVLALTGRADNLHGNPVVSDAFRRFETVVAIPEPCLPGLRVVVDDQRVVEPVLRDVRCQGVDVNVGAQRLEPETVDLVEVCPADTLRPVNRVGFGPVPHLRRNPVTGHRTCRVLASLHSVDLVSDRQVAIGVLHDRSVAGARLVDHLRRIT